MKRLFTLSFIAIATILILSNFSSVSKNTGQFIFMFIEDEPVLPETPYTYKDDIVFPKHFGDDTGIQTGYGRADIDSSFVENLDDDVATLGRVLFYDKKLSALENISCASCHNQANSFADNVARSEGVTTKTRRNSMALNDLGWTENDHFFWDMSQSDIREMIRLPLKDENEIGADMDEIAIKLSSTSYYPDLFSKAFNSDEINEEKIVEALIQFMQSMTTFNSKFDTSLDNGLVDFTDQEINGLHLFSAFCSQCHIEGNKSSLFGIEFDENFSIFELEPFIFNNGLPLSDDDLGVGEWNDNGLNHLFKVPTLRNISLTAPYMHDGSIQSLAEVVEFYSSKTEANEWSIFIQDGGYGFNNNEKLALLAFLNTLTDETFINDVKFSDPFKITETVDPGPEPEFGNLVVKPNPMGDFAIIEFTTKADIETELTIVNNVGQEILKDIILGNTYELNKANFDSGIYYLTFKQEGKSKMQKLIVQ